jgi:hypothetical protein
VRWLDRRAERFVLSSIFLLHFLHGGKKWKGETETRKTIDLDTETSQNITQTKAFLSLLPFIKKLLF